MIWKILQAVIGLAYQKASLLLLFLKEVLFFFDIDIFLNTLYFSLFLHTSFFFFLQNNLDYVADSKFAIRGGSILNKHYLQYIKKIKN